MAKLWAGRTDGNTDKAADEFNSSIGIDGRMFRQDIKGSIAHAAMLGRTGIIAPDETDRIIDGLAGILDDLESGALKIDPAAEDIHMFVEQVLTERLGELGKKLHTARSRNDQVALDTRLYLRDIAAQLTQKLTSLIAALCDRADEYKSTIMPGYTHLQRAQPVTFGHHLMAYAMMFLRDLGRVRDAKTRMNVSPIGSCALAGTTYPTDRRFEAGSLGFDGICLNSIDGVSDRDFCLELASALAITMMHLSRLSEELVLWSSWEFGFVSLSDAYTTGSSIMPQKKNPDMAELVRGKTGRVYGDLMALLTMLKGLPLAYNKDMQEDKELIFDACDTALSCLGITEGMIRTMSARPERMRAAAGEGFINATDLADYLVGRGLPFRSAYKISGGIVAYCIQNGKTLETLSLDEYKGFSDLFDQGVFAAIDMEACVNRRTSEGGTSVASVEAQIAAVRKSISESELTI
ncbi:MAG: argininosuccinate lyase [Clostridia bacterium]|nr:argininosuccinate lyase [Clostridia bacterium]